MRSLTNMTHNGPHFNFLRSIKPQGRVFDDIFLQVRVTFVEVDFITILTETNECQSNPCQNGGTCVDDVYKFTCLCPNAYAGTFCQGKTKYN